MTYDIKKLIGPKLYYYLDEVINDSDMFNKYRQSVEDSILNGDINISDKLIETLRQGFTNFTFAEITTLAVAEENVVNKLLEKSSESFKNALNELAIAMRFM